MGEGNGIYIKIELCKSKNSDEFAIRIHFDQNAPNLFRNGHRLQVARDAYCLPHSMVYRCCSAYSP